MNQNEKLNRFAEILERFSSGTKSPEELLAIAAELANHANWARDDYGICDLCVQERQRMTDQGVRTQNGWAYCERCVKATQKNG